MFCVLLLVSNSPSPCCVELSEVAWVVFGLLFLSKCVEVCRQLRAEDSSVAEEVEALGRMIRASPSPPTLLVGCYQWSGLAGARVSCQWLK